jgi:acyl-CoA thioester hydrolase
MAVRIPVHTTHIPIRWGDMDAQGHVNNTVYFRYMEQARVEWLDIVRRRLGAHLAGLDQVIVTAHCTFMVPLTYPGTVTVRMFLGPPGRSSIESQYELAMEGRTYADGGAKIVWIDGATLRSVPLPDALRAFCMSPGATSELMK